MPFILVGALIVGLMLGLMGSGGSILTVPTLVYFLGHDGKIAIAESLAIVGSIAVCTLLPYAKAHLVSWRNVLFFGVPGMGGTYLGAALSSYISGPIQLFVFGTVMLLAAVLMFRKQSSPDANRRSKSVTSPKPHQTEEAHRKTPESSGLSGWEVIVFGIITAVGGIGVGIITGLVGVGGGFLIVPALVMISRLPMRTAVGTSLAVIVLNSFSGFFKHFHLLENQGEVIDWKTVVAFVIVGIIGSFLGHAIATRMNQDVLRKGFAMFLVAMGLFVFANELPKLFQHDSKTTQHAVAHFATGYCSSPATLPPQTSVNEGVSNYHGVNR